MDIQHPGLAETLSLRRPDRFAAFGEQLQAHVTRHGCAVSPLGPVEARELTVMARATHSSYILELGAGAGESTLHLAGALGQTGRIDAVEADDVHANFIEEMARLFAVDAAIRVQRAPVHRVLPGLSGPYDLVVAHGLVADELVNELVRLVRSGGSVLLLPTPGEATVASVPGGGGTLERLAADPRLLVWFAPGLARVLAYRAR